MSNKKIFIGNSLTDLYPPIELFEKAYKLSKQEKWTITTNNPQFIEALEVLCGEENIEIYRLKNNEWKKISFLSAYCYLGDVYDIIDNIRVFRIVNHLKGDEEFNVSETWIKEEIDKYKLEYGE